MVCPKCKNPMYCIDSREKDNVRYRRYKCKWCNNRLSTIEVVGDEEYIRKHANKIIDEMKSGVVYCG